MGVITAALAIAAAYSVVRAVQQGFVHIAFVLAVLKRAVLALERSSYVLSQPPWSSMYSGGPTWWATAWRLVTLGPLKSLFAPGSFGRAYSLLVVPALAVAALACLAMLAQNEATREVIRGLIRSWRLVLSAVACLVAVLLLDDAVRVYGQVGRLFFATMRGSWAVLLGFSGLVGLLGEPESGGFTLDQFLEWTRALVLMGAAATLGVGGGTLVLQGLRLEGSTGTPGTAAGAAATRTTVAEAAAPRVTVATAEMGDAVLLAADQLSFLLYGIVLLLTAAICASLLTESELLRDVIAAAARVLRIRPLLAAVARAARWVREMPQLREAVAATRRADAVVTERVVASLRRLAESTRGMRAAVRRALEATCRVLGRLGRGLMSLGSWLKASYRSVIRPIALTAWAAAQVLLQPIVRLVRALARVGVALVRGHIAPALWPAGAAAAALWFGRQAVAQRSVVPFGAAAATSAIITALMAGKAFRKSRIAALSAAGATLERLSATAYLHLDLGLGRPASRVLGTALSAAAVTMQLMVASGREFLALLAGPLVGLLAAVGQVAAWIRRQVAAVLGPWLAAAGRAGVQAVEAVWAHPQLALVLSGVVLAAAFGAHAAQLPAAAWRLAAAAGSLVATGAVRPLLRIPLPLLRLLGSAGRLCGLTPAAAAAADMLTGWGRSSETDLSSLFQSGSFATAFVGLNLLHALLLKGWAVPSLEAEGPAGRAAVLPVISFVARSTGKVALGPLYITAAASLLAGDVGKVVAAQLGGLATPLLWLMYLSALWLEGVRRVKLSQEADAVRNSSELGRALLAVRDAVVGTRVNAGAWPFRRPPRNTSITTTANTSLSSGAPTASHEQPGAIRPAAVPAVATGARQQAAAGPAAAVPSAEPPRSRTAERRHQILREIQAQGPPGHVFATESCAVCFDELRNGAGAPGAPSPAPGTPPSGFELGSQGQQPRVATLGKGPVVRDGGPRTEEPRRDASEAAEREAADDSTPLVLRCGHAFHQGCVLRWLTRSTRCPVCREPAVGTSRHTNMLF